MNAQLTDKLEKTLNEEKWTRATINNYTINNFKEFEDIIKEFKENNQYQELKDTINEYLRHNKNSIVALYISSMLSLEELSLDENNIYNLIKIFSDNLKWNIVEYLCDKVLEYVEDKYALNTLILTYNNLNKKEKLPELWERLIKVDFEEADIVVNLAKAKEDNNEKDEAISLYKKALNRYILSKNYVQVEELWKKLLNYEEIGFEFFINLDVKISKNFSIDRSVELLKILFQKTEKVNDFNTSIKILKIILYKSPSDDFCRKEIVNVYRKKYKDHSQLEEYIKISNLDGSWRNIHDAIDNFEKHIVFDKNNFVSHRTWGIGRIMDISKDIFTINFQTKKDHKMSLKMALNSLTILPKNHITLLKLKNMDLLKKKVLEDIPWTLTVLITSFDNQASLKQIKEEMVPEVIQESKWTSWWNEARSVLKTDPKFDTLDNSNNTFQIRTKPLSFDEKIYNSFKSAKDFIQRFKLVLDYLENSDPDPDYFDEMISYFLTFLNSLNNVNENSIISYLLVTNVIKKYSFIKHTINFSFSDFFKEVEDPVEIYSNLITTDFKKDYLLLIKKNCDNWLDIFLKIFYLYPNKFIFDELANHDYPIVEKLIKDVVTRYKEYNESFFWLLTNVINDKLVEKLNLNYDNIILSVIHLIDIVNKNINLNKEVSKNKNILKQLKSYLVKEDMLIKYIDNSDKEFAKRLYTIINDLLSLDTEYLIKIKNKISDKYPDIDIDKVLKYNDNVFSKDNAADRLLITMTSYEKLQQEVNNIQNTEIPNNSKEIGWAMEKGDLKENAEFKAAKEQQTYLQNKLNKLIGDISKAVLIKKEDIKGESITFGTKVILNDLINNKKVEYTILGPFESETGKNIISYQSPLGMNLLDKKKNDEIKFALSDKKYHFIVENITVANF